MKRRAALSALGAAALGACRPRGDRAPADDRVVVVGGALTEIVFELGAGGRVVGVDTSSTYPSDTAALPKVGYQRSLAAEGIVSLTPRLLLASDEAGPPEALSLVEQSGVRVVRIDTPKQAEAIAARVEAVGAALSREAEARELSATLRAAVGDLESRARRRATRPRVLFLYARGHGTLLVGGRATAADVVLGLAGCDNAGSRGEGFFPLSPEAAIDARPDVILVPEKGLESLGGVDGLFDTPGLGSTPAAHRRRAVAVDDLLLLGLGPRVTTAIDEVTRKVFA